MHKNECSFYSSKFCDCNDAADVVEAARDIATRAHKGQFRWDKITPYIVHPAMVAAEMDTPEEQAVAWLHDVLEDTNVTYEELRTLGFSRRLLRYVMALTKSPDQPYLQYLLHLKKFAVAKKVKLADLRHNMSTMDPKKDKNKIEKYQMAVHILKS